MNHTIVDIFEQLYRRYRDVGQHHDKIRAMAYNKAIAILKKYPETMKSGGDVRNWARQNDMKGIGDKIVNKIDEIIATQNLHTLDLLKKDEDPKRVKMIDIFQTIHGIGPANAVRLYDIEKIHTIKQLERLVTNDSDILTHAQRIGIKYREVLLERIPYNQIYLFQFTIAYCLNKQFGETFKIQTAGSFRRKKATSGDIDIMLQSDSFTLDDAIRVLQRHGIVLDVLAVKDKKFMGVATCPGQTTNPFRLDIFMTTKENWWAALVTHTGPKELNTMMRARAGDMGMKLSDQGLTRGDTKISIKSEKALFQKLNMVYVIPTDR